MYTEQFSGNFGRIVLFTGAHRGGPLGGPVCRLLFNTEGPNGVLMELARIDCFIYEPHHHLSLPTLNAAKEYTSMVRVFLSERGRKLTLEEWQAAARRGAQWLRDDFTRELKDVGWGEWVIQEAEKDNAALVAAVEAFLLANPPRGQTDHA